MPEHDLVEHLKKRSAEAFEELVNQYGRRLYSVAYRILRNAQDAEDAVQETFLKAFQGIDGFRQESSVYTWLYRIVTNECLLKLRKLGQRDVVSIESYLPHFEQGQYVETVQDWNRSPELELRRQELSDFFERCIEELPEENRIAYILKDIEKLPEDQVAEILGTNKTTMKNRVHRARLVIRKRVEEHFFKKSKERIS